MYKGQHVGTFGNTGCFSFYPTKNLGAYGDAGAIVTNDGGLAARLRRLRMYGYDESNCSVETGMNGRISEMQAAILRIKLRVFPQWLNRRRELASIYDTNIANPQIELPVRYAERSHSFHQYVVRCRDRNAVTEALRHHDVAFGIHYPVPVHCMPAYERMNNPARPLTVTEQASKEILSLPIHEALEDEEVQEIARILNGTSGNVKNN
jgi:dTDP-4-amino-4,6-dideoxygalactose transaminase